MIGIIGGTGIDQLQGLHDIREHLPDTEFGRPSRSILEGQLGSRRVLFLQRHGSPGAIPPT
ncbi:nucleoside phosphorylase-I family protein [Kineobactrum salinum]|uniref:hypothetical protein n=1 Tax=Kineobactrum salinum TaxID=2708301 RepID=UPI001E32F7EE|nr:hypothetical protein [Kineobactrum salinum]